MDSGNAVSRAARRKRKNAWEKDVRTRKLNDKGRQIFEEHRASLVRGKISRTKLAELIYDDLIEGDDGIDHFQPRTIQGRIKKWLSEI